MCIPAYVAYVPYLCKLKQLVFCHILNNAVALLLAEKKLYCWALLMVVPDFI